MVSLRGSVTQAKFLLRNDADAVTYPEKQLAKWAAIRYTANHIFSYIELDEKYAIIEVAVPDSWQGRSIGELDVRKRYGVNILGVKRSGKTNVTISPETVLRLTLLVLGEYTALKNASVCRFPAKFTGLSCRAKSDRHMRASPFCISKTTRWASGSRLF